MPLIDSSVWIEFFGGGPRADRVAPYFEKSESIIVPSLVIFEVSKYFLKTMDEDAFLPYLAQMQGLTIVPLTDDLAYQASVVSLQKKLGMADAIILATAQMKKVKLITLDNDFRGMSECVIPG